MKKLNYIERYESKITTFDYFAVDIDDENIIYQNTSIETMQEGLELMEEIFDNISNSDGYVIDFNLVK